MARRDRTARVRSEGSSAKMRGRSTRYRVLVLRFVAVPAATAASQQQTPALDNPYDVIAVRVGNTVNAQGSNHNVRLTYAYQAGEQIVTAGGSAEAIAGRAGLGGYLDPPVRVSKGVQLNVNVTNDEAAAASTITVAFHVREYYRRSAPEG